jgi:hypothetical protein
MQHFFAGINHLSQFKQTRHETEVPFSKLASIPFGSIVSYVTYILFERESALPVLQRQK